MASRAEASRGLRPRRSTPPAIAPPARRGSAARIRAAFTDYYFNSMRLVPANVVWGAGLVVIVLVGLVWPLGGLLLLPLLALPTAGIFRLAARIVRVAPDAGWRDVAVALSPCCRRSAGARRRVWSPQAWSSARTWSPGSEPGRPPGWVLATLAGWGLVALWSAALVAWPLVVGSGAGRTSRCWAGSVSRGALLLAHPVRIGALAVVVAVMTVDQHDPDRGPPDGQRRIRRARGLPGRLPGGRPARSRPGRGAPVTLPIQVGPSTITMNRDDRFVVCQPDGRIDREAEEGFFARDTRFVSGYKLFINGQRPLLLNASPVQFFSSRFEYSNPELLDRDGIVPRQSLALRIDRTVSGGVHEDYDLVNYGRRTVRLTIEIEIESDFADIFDVKSGQLVRRGEINARWFRSARELRTTYVHRDFVRELVLRADRSDSTVQFANGRFVFIAEVRTKGRLAHVHALAAAHALEAPSGRRSNATRLPDRGRSRPSRGCDASGSRRRTTPSCAPGTRPSSTWTRSSSEDPAFEKGVFIPAAGVPWFVTLFGRDSLVVSMQGISGYPEFASGRASATVRAAGDRRRSRARHGAGQDPARDPPRRARPTPDPAVPALLRDPRRNEPVRHRRSRTCTSGWGTSRS